MSGRNGVVTCTLQYPAGLLALVIAGCATTKASQDEKPVCLVLLSRQCDVPRVVDAKGNSSSTFTMVSPVFELPAALCPPEGDLEGTPTGLLYLGTRWALAFNDGEVAGLSESAMARQQVEDFSEWMMELPRPCSARPTTDFRSTWARFSRRGQDLVADSARLKASWLQNGYSLGCAEYEAPHALRKVPTEICP